MGIVKQEDILGYWIDNGSMLVCADCVKDNEIPEEVGDKIVDRDEVENSEDLYYCDRCKKRIG